MAEFPHPEYRNLWRGSKLSKDMAAVGGATGRASTTQISDGIRIVTGPKLTVAYSLTYTNSGYIPATEPNSVYSWLIPFRNSGTVPFPVRTTTWVRNSAGATIATASDSFTLQPGEIGYSKLQNLTSDGTIGDIRWSMYYTTSGEMPPEGGVIDVLDGIVLVKSPTAPPFPFNGDGAIPVETLKRRNANPNPSFESNTNGYTRQAALTLNRFSTPGYQYSGQYGATADVGDGATTLTYVGSSRVACAPGQWVGSLVHLRTSSWVRTRVIFRNSSDAVVGSSPYITGFANPSTAFAPQPGVAQAPATAAYALVYFYVYSTEAGDAPVSGSRVRFDAWLITVADTEQGAQSSIATYFDGDTPASGNIVRRWAPDGTSLEIEVTQPPEGRTTVWDGEPYKSTSTLWVGPASGVTGVMDIGAATDARLGIVSDIYSRSQEKIKLVLATPDENLVSGRRVELSAAAYTATPVVWRWRQITGPAVELDPWDNNVDFIAPDVDEETTVRVGVYAISEDGRNRSDWHYFDLPILPPTGRFLLEGTAEYVPTIPSIVGYGRGRREVWNDVVRPAHFWANPRNEVEVVDLGITPDDVQFSVEQPESCAAGGVYINPETGDVFRNFGAGYNETDDKTGAPRTNAYWLNPATGDILEWRGA